VPFPDILVFSGEMVNFASNSAHQIGAAEVACRVYIPSLNLPIAEFLRKEKSPSVHGVAFSEAPLRGVEAGLCGDHSSPAHTVILSYFKAVLSFIHKLIVHQGAGRLTNICSVIGGCLETLFPESCKLYYFDSH
jgi:hypothetical protein